MNISSPTGYINKNKVAIKFVWNDEMDGDIGCTILWLFLVSLNYTLINAHFLFIYTLSQNFILYILPP